MKVYKIIYLVYNPNNPAPAYTFDMLPERFDSKEEAKEFLRIKEFPAVFNNLVGTDNPEDFSYKIVPVGAEEIDFITYFITYCYGETSTITEYIIKEV